MHGSMSLNGTWGLTHAEGAPMVDPMHYTSSKLPSRRLMPAAVPGSIHQILLDQGLIDDPNLGLNSLKARWVEEQFWIYRHVITVPADATTASAWLVFDKLEYETIVWLNGEEIGRHINAHRPARFDVTGKLRPGENLLVVQVSAGIHNDEGTGAYTTNLMAHLTKRVLHRKPQYQGGWDWNARLTNVGILGDVTLEWGDGPRMDQASVFALPSDDLSEAALTARAFVEHPGSETVEGRLEATIRETGQTAGATVAIAPGESCHELTLDMTEPKLWWPIGTGEQHLYTVDIKLTVGEDVHEIMRKTGVRRVELDQSPHPVEGKYFIVRINNRPVFCKGGNWVPADMLYSTVTPERYRKLVDLAIRANFNMLRIWGGGCFADHSLCEACDEAGILIWHDFLFACAKYPGDDPAFAAEVRREVTFATRDLAHHPSIVVWCGNNEIEWGDWDWGYDDRYKTHPHYAMFHHDIPMIATRENPATAYWISSPYSPEFAHPNSPIVGDQHPWNVSILEPGGADFWIYRGYVDRFPNEGGVIGATGMATLKQFLPEDQRYLLSPSWEHHDNPLACTATEPGELGRVYDTVRIWTGRDPLAMDWQEYAFISGLLQAEGLSEYIANYRRRMFSSASAIFWMYNDSWPVTHGWTIVDYYLREKLAYHPVRRSFQPVSVIVAEENDDLVVFGVNDTPSDWSGQLRFGLFGLDGGRPADETIDVSLIANRSTVLARLPRRQFEAIGVTEVGAFALLQDGGATVAQHRLLLARFKDLKFARPQVRMGMTDGRLTLKSKVFVWGVCLDCEGDAGLADNCFDLLPGIPYVMDWSATLGEPTIQRTGNAWFLDH